MRFGGQTRARVETLVNSHPRLTEAFFALKSIVSEKYEEKFLNMISSCLKNSSKQNNVGYFEIFISK
jgi:hypothetical protein